MEKLDISLAWHSLSSEEVLEKLNTPAYTGLTTEEAVEREKTYGPNLLAEAKKPGFLKKVIDQLNSFVVILLIVASVVSAVLGDYVEAGAIMLIVVLNSVLGVVQESRAEEALAALKKLAAPEAQVLRDGHRVSISAEKLVPGDIIFVEAGNYIPADVRLIEASNLRIEEAALTGESVSVQKNATVLLEKDAPLGNRKNTAFMGTLVSYGRGRGVVVNTGMHTQLGMIASMLQQVKEEDTPLQRRLDQLAKTLGIATLGICAVVFGLGLARNLGDVQAIVNIFMIAVSLAIAAVPEGLPAVVTISLALGMREMVRKHALIRRLASVETLGSATVICSDKTGTLTQNEMTATRMWVDGKWIEITGIGYDRQGEFHIDERQVDLKDFPAVQTALWVGVLNNDAQLEVSGDGSDPSSLRMVGDPTEGALLVAAAKAGVLAEALNQAYPRANEIPFDSVRKRMVTLHSIREPRDEDVSPIYGENHHEWYALAVKGAPDEVLNLCTHLQSMDDRTLKPMDEEMRLRILAANDRMTQESLRVLGLAYRLLPAPPVNMDPAELEKDLIFAGLIGMIDPPRPEANPALAKARNAGIRTLMITGDYPNTARAIAEAIGLLRPGHKVMSGAEIGELDDHGLQQEVLRTDVYARVSPEHKMRIVDALRANGEVVAMTGDGVNDAPAIKRADIGVAMGITGTDVAKETADMVLTDDNYASIVSAVEQGRIIYSNIRKFVYYLLSCNLAEISIIFLATLFDWPSPLTAIQLLWLNLITDGAPALALGTEKGDPDIMDRPPRPPKEPIINRYMIRGISVQTIAITAVTLGAYAIGRFTDPAHIEYAEAMAFVTLSCSELMRAYTARSEYYPVLKIGPFKNRWMNLAILSSLVLILAVVYVPFLQPVFNTRALGLAQWEMIIPLLFVPSIAAELTKLAFSPARKKK
ncbi:MAG: cation-translocating P-type ATPase [Chloroflexi bacterium]|nr:cation-translocating P-type ATPase [Chloroflexota bacterium]